MTMGRVRALRIITSHLERWKSFLLGREDWDGSFPPLFRILLDALDLWEAAVIIQFKTLGDSMTSVQSYKRMQEKREAEPRRELRRGIKRACGGLNETDPDRLMYLNSWSPVGRTAWEGVGGVVRPYWTRCVTGPRA